MSTRGAPGAPTPALTPMRASAWLACIAAFVALAVALGWQERDPELAVKNRPLQAPSEEYASSNTCRSCHPREYQTWRNSYHQSMTQAATPESVLPRFESETLSVYGQDYQLDRRGDEFWVVQDAGLDGQSGVEERRVVMTTGSHHFQAFWLETGDRRDVALFPFAYAIAEEHWLPFDAMILAPPEAAYRQANTASGQWNRVCSQCHSTAFRPRLDENVGADTHVTEFGIACEACHGPGEEHVRLNQNPLRRYQLHLTDGQDPSIVQPQRLYQERVSEVCAQCHAARGVYRGITTAEYHAKGSPFRPGDVLAEQLTIAHSDGEPGPFEDVHTRFWSDGMVRVNGREYNSLLRSPCHQRGELTCLSCHQLHQTRDDPRPPAAWADDQLKPGMRGNAACLQCHGAFEDTRRLTAHTKHRSDSSGSECMNCHMPYVAWGLQKATRSHEIANPSVQESLDTGRANACNGCHLDRTLEWTAAWLERQYGIPAPELSEEQREVAAAVRWILSGDAGQRALMTWAMGWDAAHEASGRDWVVPYLGLQLLDRYPVNRYVALRSLRKLPGYEDFTVEAMSPEAERIEANRRLVRIFVERGAAHDLAEPGRVLIDANGGLRVSEADALLAVQNQRRVYLKE